MRRFEADTGRYAIQPVRPGRAMGAGLLGGIAILAVMMAARQLGWRADLELALGTLLLPPNGGTWLAGLALHLAFSSAAGLVYARLFETSAAAGAGTGALIGIAHAWLMALITLIVWASHVGGAPVLSGVGGTDGSAAYFDGAGLTLYWASHVVYGAIVGATYAMGRVVHRHST